MVNYEPRIAIFHDVISPANIEHLKSIASKGVCFKLSLFFFFLTIYFAFINIQNQEDEYSK